MRLAHLFSPSIISVSDTDFQLRLLDIDAQT